MSNKHPLKELKLVTEAYKNGLFEEKDYQRFRKLLLQQYEDTLLLSRTNPQPTEVTTFTKDKTPTPILNLSLSPIISPTFEFDRDDPEISEFLQPMNQNISIHMNNSLQLYEIDDNITTDKLDVGLVPTVSEWGECWQEKDVDLEKMITNSFRTTELKGLEELTEDDF
jgi:hypothetical protein